MTFPGVREEVVDFTLPYYTEGYAIVSAAPGIIGQSLSILRPFTYEVWVLLILSIVVIGPVIYVMERIGARVKFETTFGNRSLFRNYFNRLKTSILNISNDPNVSENFWSIQLTREQRLLRKLEGERPIYLLPAYSFNFFKTILIQGNSLFSTLDSVRLMMAFWFLFGLVMTCAFI